MKSQQALWNQDRKDLQRFLGAYPRDILIPKNIDEELVYSCQEELEDRINENGDRYGHVKNVKHAYEMIKQRTAKYLTDCTGHFDFELPKVHFTETSAIDDLVSTLIEADPISDLVLDKQGIAVLVGQGIIVIPENEISSTYDEISEELEQFDFEPQEESYLQSPSHFFERNDDDIDPDSDLVFEWTNSSFQYALFEAFVSASFYQIRGDWLSTGSIGNYDPTPEEVESDLLEHNLRKVYELHTMKKFSDLHRTNDELYLRWAHETLFNWQHKGVFDRETRAAFDYLTQTKTPAQVAAITNYKIDDGIVVPTFEGFNKEKRKIFYHGQ